MTVPLGHHLLLELHGCPASLLRDVATVQERMESVLAQAGATRLSSHFHQFEPHGVSGVAILAESHATIHTWPEHGYAAVDVFTCGHPGICGRIPSLCREAFEAASDHHRILDRGRPAPGSAPSTSAPGAP